MKTSIYICPVCGRELAEDDRRAVCPVGHAFDRASEGYINLLLPSRGGVHGDNRDMVLARRRFLDCGYYDALAERVCARVTKYMRENGVLLDMGAGECFYTDRIERALTASSARAQIYAFDISKDAIRYAARRNRALQLFVAGAYHMPVSSDSIDIAINLFAPLAPEETHRVLREDGIFILAVPEREHLFGLKTIVYDTPYKNTVSDPTLDGFALLDTEEILYTVTVEGQQAISDLLYMTPYGYRSPRAGVLRLLAQTSVTTPVHFRLFIYKKL